MSKLTEFDYTQLKQKPGEEHAAFNARMDVLRNQRQMAPEIKPFVIASKLISLLKTKEQSDITKDAIGAFSEEINKAIKNAGSNQDQLAHTSTAIKGSGGIAEKRFSTYTQRALIGSMGDIGRTIAIFAEAVPDLAEQRDVKDLIDEFKKLRRNLLAKNK